MDINQKDGYGTKQPRGGATTLLDLVNRDIQDNTLFPLDTSVTKFTRDETLRTVPMSSVMREFTFKGPASLGQTFMFELGDMNYSNNMRNLPEDERQKIDLVLVDGRFRVACSLKCFAIIKPDCLIAFDDFLKRPQYHIVLDYYNIVEKTKDNSMVILQKKGDVSYIAEDIIKKYELIAD